MGLVIRQSFYSTIISYIGVVIGYVNLLYLYPKFMQPEQVGLLRTIQDAAILFTPFAQFGLAQTIVRYFPRMVKDQNTSGSFISLMLALSVGGFAIFFIAFTIFEASLLSYFESNAREIINYASLVLWLTLILLLIAVLEAYSRSLLKTIFPNLLREIVARLLLAILIILYFQGYLDYHQFIIGTVVTYLLCLATLLLYLWLGGHLQLTTQFKQLDSAKFPELIQYSLLSFAGTAGLIIIGKVDSLMISGMIGLTANAVYTTAFYMATVIEVPKRALSQVAMPLIARAFEKNDMKDIATIYRKTSINQFIIGTLLIIGVWINLDSIFQLMPRNEIYEAGKWVVIIIGLGKLADMLFGPSSEIIVLSKYYKFNIVLILSLAAVIIISNNALIPRYGINGAAIGAAVALVLFNAAKCIFIYVKLKMQPFDIATIKVLLIGIATFGLNYIIPKQANLLVDVVVRSGAITVFYSVLILLSKASPDGNSFLKRILQLLK
jgi:O-antigen/teichoic acid export membrane protein